MQNLFTDAHEDACYADVIVPLNIDGMLTYGLPHDMIAVLKPGMRVEVPLGRNKTYAAIVAAVHSNKPDAYEVKPVRSLIDELPVVNDIQLAFWKWIGEYYLATPGEVMQAALPAHLKLSGETRLQWAPKDPENLPDWSDEGFLAAEALEMRNAITIADMRRIVGPKNLTRVINELLEAEAILINDGLEATYKPRREKVVTLSPEFGSHQELARLFDELSKAPKQLQVLMAYTTLAARDEFVLQKDLASKSNTGTGPIRALADKGVFILETRDVDRVQYSGNAENREIELTPPQEAALVQIKEGFASKRPVLLEGVTGSGKTLLYIEQIRACIASGRQALFLLPEIGLTTQLMRRLYNYFGEELGVYHSRFSNNERVEIWEKVLHKKYSIVVGPRSALWLPFEDLGLIIVDEEHDASYKQRDPAPRFHARDAAIYLAGLHQSQVLLGSATPSLESLYNVQQSKYAYAALKERYLGVALPVIEVVNARSLDAVRKLGFRILTPELQAAMAEALAANRQIILFQNRRGYAPFQICTVCGWVPQCTNCAVSMTYHKHSDRMQCHYCGRAEPAILNCPQCGSNKVASPSYGTERIEEEVKQGFPKSRVARMDLDSMRGRTALSVLLDSMEKQEIDILVGTQMVVKGLDFAPVALVSVLNADGLLSFPDFRVNERAFQLMEQVAGRAGRGDGKGKVIIQAYNLQHPVLQWVIHHDVGAFYRYEIGYREHFFYPPFSRIIKVVCKSREEQKAIQAALDFAQELHTFPHIVVQGPVPSLISKVRNQFLQEVQIKCPKNQQLILDLKSFLRNLKQRVAKKRGMADLQVLFDVDPV